MKMRTEWASEVTRLMMEPLALESKNRKLSCWSFAKTWARRLTTMRPCMKRTETRPKTKDRAARSRATTTMPPESHHRVATLSLSFGMKNGKLGAGTFASAQWRMKSIAMPVSTKTATVKTTRMSCRPSNWRQSVRCDQAMPSRRRNVGAVAFVCVGWGAVDMRQFPGSGPEGRP